MEDYFAAKRKLFTELVPAHAVINVENQYGRRLAAELPDPLTFSLSDPSATTTPVASRPV
jgi:UDP-N-acetylmuramyl tripeptide synthase